MVKARGAALNAAPHLFSVILVEMIDVVFAV